MRSRERCPKCGIGRMKIVTTRTTGSLRKRYLKCSECDETGKEVLRIDDLGRPIYSGNTTTSTGAHCAPSNPW